MRWKKYRSGLIVNDDETNVDQGCCCLESRTVERQTGYETVQKAITNR
jgi:hypothetical protein